jgi:hypothetical protein
MTHGERDTLVAIAAPRVSHEREGHNSVYGFLRCRMKCAGGQRPILARKLRYYADHEFEGLFDRPA